MHTVSRFLPLLVLSMLAGHATGQESEAVLPELIDAEEELSFAQNDDLDFVRRRGVDLYERHQAALVALDAGREVGLPETDPEGWIVLREADALRVRFVATCPEGPCSVLDVVIDAERLSAGGLYPPEPLGPRGIQAWRARNLVLSTQTATCSVPYNVVTFPPDESESGWTAYLIAQPEEEDVMAIGGHMRVFLDADAESVLVAEDFSPACLLGRRDASRNEFGINYPQASVPAEIHVLQSLLHQVVFYVGTPFGVFTVNGDEIRTLDDRSIFDRP